MSRLPIRLILAVLTWALTLAFALPATQAQSLQRANTPEDVGFSSERLKRISTAMQAAVDQGEIPGAAIVIARKGRMALGGSVGFRDREAGLPIDLDSIHRIGSMTKPITSLAVMMLVEEGRIRLADPASMYLPEFKDLKVGVERKGDGLAHRYTRGILRRVTSPDHRDLWHSLGAPCCWQLTEGGRLGSCPSCRPTIHSIGMARSALVVGR